METHMWIVLWMHLLWHVTVVTSLFSPDKNTVLLFDFHSQFPNPVNEGSIIYDKSRIYNNNGRWHGNSYHYDNSSFSNDSCQPGLYFGANDSVEVTTHGQSLALNANLTIEIWAKVENKEINSVYIVHADDSCHFPGFMEDGIVFWLGKYTKTTNDGREHYTKDYLYTHNLNLTLQDHIHHFAFTYDQKHLKIYVDGKYITNKTANGSLYLSNPTWYIGNVPRANANKVKNFEGFVYGLRLSNIARTKQDIKKAYMTGKITFSDACLHPVPATSLPSSTENFETPSDNKKIENLTVYITIGAISVILVIGIVIGGFLYRSHKNRPIPEDSTSAEDGAGLLPEEVVESDVNES